MNQNTVAIAKDNMVRISPIKLSFVVNNIVDMKVSKAINQLKFSEKRVSKSILNVLNAAIANAENNKQLDIDKLFIKEAYCGKQITMKRFRPRAKGRAAPILKPYSNLTIILSEKLQTKEAKDGTKG